MMDEQPGCAEIRELLPELAAGVAAGEERARLLAHLSGCADCRRELEALATVVDELMMLVPPVEPPAGFDSSVLAKMVPGPVPSGLTSAATREHASRRPSEERARRRRAGESSEEGRRDLKAPGPARAKRAQKVLRLALAGILGAAAGVGGTLVATADERRFAAAYRATLVTANGRFLAARALHVSGGPRVGTVFAYEGTPSWVFIVVRDHDDGVYPVYMSTVDGQNVRLGVLSVRGGRGSWGGVIGVGVRQIAQVRLDGPTYPPLVAVFR